MTNLNGRDKNNFKKRLTMHERKNNGKKILSVKTNVNKNKRKEKDRKKKSDNGKKKKHNYNEKRRKERK